MSLLLERPLVTAECLTSSPPQSISMLILNPMLLHLNPRSQYETIKQSVCCIISPMENITWETARHLDNEKLGKQETLFAHVYTSKEHPVYECMDSDNKLWSSNKGVIMYTIVFFLSQQNYLLAVTLL